MRDGIKFISQSKKEGIKPKFHVSEQGSGRCGHHSDYIKNLENIDAYLWISINELIESTSKNYVYKLR